MPARVFSGTESWFLRPARGLTSQSPGPFPFSYLFAVCLESPGTPTKRLPLALITYIHLSQLPKPSKPSWSLVLFSSPKQRPWTDRRAPQHSAAHRIDGTHRRTHVRRREPELVNRSCGAPLPRCVRSHRECCSWIGRWWLEAQSSTSAISRTICSAKEWNPPTV